MTAQPGIAVRRQPAGMRAFLVVWFGQVISLFGTSMSRFALTIWAWEITGEATALALVGLFSFGPGVIVSPIAGALVDRWNRKLVMMISDLAAGLSTVAIFILYSTDSLQIWHLYVAGAFASTFESFQFPAYSAAVTMMVPKKHYARASGMLSMAESGAQIFAPAAAGVLLSLIGVSGVLVVDIVTFTFAVSAVSLVFIPQPPVSEASSEHKGNLWREVKYGFRYIVERRSLLGLQMMFFFSNLFATLGFVLLSPMILARTGNDSVQLGSAMSVGAVGGLIGAILVSAWGGPRRRVHGVLLGMAASSLLGQVTVGLGRALPVWAIGGFCSAFFIGIINSSNQAIWQAKVAPDVQGRVFATRRLIAQITAPAAMLVAGPLADVIFEPAMMPDGLLADTFGPIVGTGPGAGMALILVITGLLGGMAALSGYLFPAIRNAEDLIPDHDVDPEKLAQTTGLQLEMAGMLPPDMSAPSAAEGAVIAGD